jgi:hypothetical protein
MSCCTFLLSAGLAADLKPADGGPVFSIFASGSTAGSGAPTINIAGKEPLMVVSTLSNVQLSDNRKAVRLTMTGPDTRKFAGITRKHLRELLVIEANGRVLEAMRVSSPVTNGVLEFTYPDDAAAADYLRKRFRLK